MDKFLILFRHELKSQLPLPKKGRRYDLFGFLLVALLIGFISFVFIRLLSAVVSGYVLVKVNKIADPLLRAKELLNACYVFVLAVLVMAGLESMRRSLTDHKHKELFLRMPVSSKALFLSKIAALLVSAYALAFVLIATLSLVFYTSASLSAAFLWRSAVVWLFMPPAAFLISTLLLVPYIKIVEFVSNKYALMLVLISSLIMGAFLVYSRLLEAVQSLLETGSIKYLFNERFVNTLDALLKWCYPASAYSSIALGGNLLLSLAIALVLAALAPAVVVLISKRLFTATLYSNAQRRRTSFRRGSAKKLSPLQSLIKKEFISIYRDPKSTFSYFAVAASMPVMVYCCYTLFESLIQSTIGMSVSFPLATVTVLIFSILTNTFCATNVSRDGAAAIKVKTYPVKASTIILAKVLLCATVSSLSILVSLGVLAFAAGVSLLDAFIAALIALAFSLAQIFVATRMDLGAARLSSDLAEMRSANNVTIAKVVILGMLLALIAGVLSVVSYVFSLGTTVGFIKELGLKRVHAYLFPSSISALYLCAAVAYYRIGIDKSLESLSL